MQVVKTQPTGAFTQGGAGIGAVIFDRPQYDTAKIAMQVSNDLDAWDKRNKQEAANRQKQYQKLIADLDFDTTGVLNNDRPRIKELSQSTIETLSSALQTNSPEDWAKHQSSKALLENAVKASKMDAELLKVTNDPEKLSKIDNADDLFQKAAVMRTAPIDSEERIKARSAWGTIPTQKTSLEILTDKLKQVKGKEETSEVIQEPKTGGFTVEKTSTYLPDSQVSDLAEQLEYDPKYSKARMAEWQQAIGYNPQTKEIGNKDIYETYVKQSSLPENKGKSPYRLFIEDQIKSFQNVSKTSGGITFTPRQKEDIKFKYKTLGSSLPAAPYAESLSALFNKDKSLWKEVPSSDIKGHKEYVSNLYYGTKIGGDAIKLNEAKEVDAKVPNVIEQWKMDDEGNVYLMTTQTKFDNEADNTKPKYVKITNAGEVLPSIIQAEFGEQADDIIGGFYDQVKRQGASLGGTSYNHDYFYKTTKDDEGKFVRMRGYNKGYGGETLPPVERSEPTQQEQPKQGAKTGGASKEDQAALDWLKANPTAPQADAIRKTLKAKGLIK